MRSVSNDVERPVSARVQRSRFRLQSLREGREELPSASVLDAAESH